MKNPDWLRKENIKKVWSEDDCAPDAERIESAWKRLFQVNRIDEIRIDTFDGGDCDYILYESGRIACLSYPGNSEIYIHIGVS